MMGGIYIVMWHFSWPNRGVFGSWWWNDRRNIYCYVAFQLAEQRCASCVFGSWLDCSVLSYAL